MWSGRYKIALSAQAEQKKKKRMMKETNKKMGSGEAEGGDTEPLGSPKQTRLSSGHVFGGIRRHCVSSLDSKEWCHGGFSTALDISENNFPHRLILAQNLNI